jgi:flagellar biosynthetic protein FliQ
MPDQAVETVRIALFQALLIALPILGAGLLVGLFISLFQAVTQIQEQTLTFVPKIIVMIVVAIILLGWISVRMVEFATEMFSGIAFL